jgi:hypothetical protein
MSVSIAITLIIILTIITSVLEICLYKLNIEIKPILEKAGLKAQSTYYVIFIYAISAWLAFLFVLVLVWMP